MSLGRLEHELLVWTIRCGLARDNEADVLEALCARLVAGGIPLWRVAIGADLLHPLIDARVCRWQEAGGLVREEFPRTLLDDAQHEEDWRASPFYHLLRYPELRELRRRLEAEHRAGEFPLLDAFRAQGATDYVLFKVDFGAQRARQPGILCSYATRHAGGFAEAEIELLRNVTFGLGLACKAITAVETASTLAETYLGADAGGRVLDGAIGRGVAETVRAVLWYSDLAGFTRIADTATGDALIALLNDYAEAVASAIHAAHGQVLKFIGDGVLAMFPLGEEAGPCERALDTAEAVLAAVDRLGAERRAKGLPATDIRIALHVGDVLYGNIGSPNRLDFTVVGPAVNEVARIEGLCRALEQRVIVSSAFAAEAGGARTRLVSLGRYALKGVRRPEELFTLDLAD